MSMDYLQYMAEMEMGEPSLKEDLDAAENSLGIVFPAEYRRFMLKTNGAEGSIGKSNYLVIWPVEEIVELNEEYGVAEFTPGLIYFGSDGGGMAYAFDVREEVTRFVRFPFDSIHIEDEEIVATVFNDFIKALYDD